MKDILLQLNF